MTQNLCVQHCVVHFFLGECHGRYVHEFLQEKLPGTSVEAAELVCCSHIPPSTRSNKTSPNKDQAYLQSSQVHEKKSWTRFAMHSSWEDEQLPRAPCLNTHPYKEAVLASADQP